MTATPQPGLIPIGAPTAHRSLAVVIPLLNEANGLKPLLARLIPVLNGLGLNGSD